MHNFFCDMQTTVHWMNQLSKLTHQMLITTLPTYVMTIYAEKTHPIILYSSTFYYNAPMHNYYNTTCNITTHTHNVTLLPIAITLQVYNITCYRVSSITTIHTLLPCYHATLLYNTPESITIYRQFLLIKTLRNIQDDNCFHPDLP